MKFLVFAVMALFVGCGGDEADRAASIAALSGDDTSGKALYDIHCNRCHAAGGVGSPDGDDIRGQSKDSAIDSMLTGPGSMPLFDALADQELADIAAYVATL